jgi:hypothetical protein
MEMRPRYAAGGTDETNLLTALHRVTHRYERLGEVEITRDHTRAMVDVDDVPRKKEVVDQRDHSAVRRSHDVTGLAREVHTAMAARKPAVEDASGAEGTRDPGAPWAKKWFRPENRRRVRSAAHRTRFLVFPLDARLCE